MKKLISLMLSVVLVFSLCAPAVAAQDLNPPLYEQYGYSSLDEMIAEWEITVEEYYAMAEEQLFFENWKYDPATGDMDPAIWEYEGYASKEEYLSDWGLTEEEYREIVTDYRVSYDWHYDEATGDFDPPLWRGYGFESKEAMLKEWEITEEEYYEQVESERIWQEQQDWTEEDWEAYYEEQREIEKDAMGLTYDINVMFRDDPFMFTDAVPEIVNDRVMVPLRAVMENMGAEVNYDDTSRTAVITREDTQLTFVLGSDRFTVKTGDETREIVLDSAPYIKHDRVFVPIRFVAESLGYDVYWSEDYRTGVYFDREEIVAELNEKYSIANGVMAMGSDLDLSKNYKGNVDMELKVTAYDSIAGNQTFTIGLDAVVVENQTSAKMTMEFDIASIIDLIEAMAKEAGEDMNDPDMKMIFDLLDAINDDSIDMIIDLDKGVYYMRGSLFAVMGEYTNTDLDGNTWVEIDLSSLTGVDYSQIMAMAQDLSGKLTVGDFIYMMCTSGENEYVYAYDAMRFTSGVADLVADSQFTKSGSGYKYSLDVADLVGLDGTFKIGANVTMKNGIASRVKANLDMAADEVTMDIDMDMTALDAQMTGNIHIKNVAKVQFTVNSTVSETAEEVPTAPPAGAKIITFEELENLA